jgi:hypothetical protein
LPTIVVCVLWASTEDTRCWQKAGELTQSRCPRIIQASDWSRSRQHIKDRSRERRWKYLAKRTKRKFGKKAPRAEKRLLERVGRLDCGQRCRRSKMVWCGAGWPDQEGVKKNTANLYDGEDLKPRYTIKGKLGVSAAVRKVRWKPEQP